MRTLLVGLMLAACAGCSGGNRDYLSREGGVQAGHGNVLRFQHPFTEAAVAKVRAQADRHCAETRLVAIRTRVACTMSECATDYQCMTGEEAARVAP